MNLKGENDMSQLKIYTNANHEIKALYYTDDKTLTEHIVDLLMRR